VTIVGDGAIYRGFDQAELDAQYNARGSVANHEAVIAQREADSKAALARFPHTLDVAYGPSEAEKLDIFPAGGEGPKPIHLYFHGGYWYSRDKNQFSFLANRFQPAGAALLIVNYTLMPAVDLDKLVDQCRAAVAWAHANAAGFGGDPDRLFVSGNSAGGHLAAMLMATDWPATAGLPADTVKGGCAFSGLYDLEPVRRAYINDILGLDEGHVARNSPLTLKPATRAPIVFAVGADETDEFRRQSRDMAAAWKAHGADATFLERPGQNHFSIVADFADPKSPLSQAAFQMMGLA